MDSPTVWVWMDENDEDEDGNQYLNQNWAEQVILFDGPNHPDYPGAQAQQIPAHLYYEFTKLKNQAFNAFLKIDRFYQNMPQDIVEQLEKHDKEENNDHRI